MLFRVDGMLKNNNFSWTAVLSYAFYGFIVALFICTILQNPNYIFGDNEKFMLEYIKGGKTILPFAWGGRGHWSSLGRFWPMYFQEYNLLCFFPDLTSRDNIAFSCYLLNGFLFLLFSFSFFVLLKQIISSNGLDFTSPWIVLILPLTLCFFLFNQEFDRCFWDIIFAERVLVVLLSIYLVSYYSAYIDKKNSVRCVILYGIAGISAVLMTYYKETAFLFSLIPACVWLLFAYRKITKEHRILCFFMLFNAVVFLILYYFFAYRQATQFYNSGRSVLSVFGVACFILCGDYILAAAFGAAAMRGFFIVFRKDDKHLFFDAVLLASVAAACSYFILRLPDLYYYVPAFVGIIFVAVYWLVVFGRSHYWGPYLFLILFVAIFIFYNQGKVLRLYKDVQKCRKMDYSFSWKIADKIKIGKNAFLLFFQNDRQGEYWLNILSSFLRYSLEDRSKHSYIKHMNSIPADIKDGDLIILSRTSPQYSALISDYADGVLEKVEEHDLFSVYQKRKSFNLPVSIDLNKYSLLSGFFAPEAEGRWIVTDKAEIRLNFSPIKMDCLFKLSFNPYLLPQLPKRQVSVWCNGEKIKEWIYTLTVPGNGFEIFVLPARFMKSGKVELQIRTSPVISPKELRINDDPRRMGIFMRQLTVEPVPAFEKGDEINFSNPALETSGFFQIEQTGRWTVASEATLRFDAFRISPYHDLNLAFTVFPCLSPKYPEKTIRVFANGVFVTTWKMTAQDKYPAIKKLRIPQKILLSSEGKLALRFDISPLFTPESQNLSSDTRLLGVHFMKVKQE